MTRPQTASGPVRTQPRWSPEYFDRDRLMKGGYHLDAAQFTATDSVTATVGAGGAAQNAETIPVAALSGAIPAGVVLQFGAANSGKYATLAAPAAAGATALAVHPLPVALVAGDVATFAGAGLRSVRSGTYVGRTRAERDAGQGFGPALATDDERFLVAFTVVDVTAEAGFVPVKHNVQVWENRLPGFAALAAGVQAALRADYLTSIGAD